MSFAEKMAAIGPRYLARTAQRVADLAPILDRVDQHVGSDLSDLRFVFHDIAGTAASIGYPDVGLRARAADEIILGVLRSGGPLTAEEVRSVRGAASDITRMIGEARAE